MSILNTIRSTFLIASLSILYAGNANAIPTINLNAKTNGYLNPVDVVFTPGTYTITPVSRDYSTWRAWGSTTCHDPNGCPRTKPTTYRGWLNKFSFSSADLIDVLINGSPASHDAAGLYSVDTNMVYRSAESALAHALSAQFTLTTTSTVSFLLPDNGLHDNRGGMSLQVVPEPSILALMALGLVGIGFTHRKKA